MSTPKLNSYNQKYGPLQIVHDFHFVSINVKDDYSFIFDMSHEEKIEYMKGRVKRLFDRGYGGVVLNVDFKNYLDDEESFTRVNEIAHYARELGMRVWIYDEQYYPSGTGGGHTLKNHPELEAICLSCVTKTVESDGTAIRIPSPLGHSDLKYAIAVPVIDGIEDHSKRINVSDKKDLSGGFCYNAPEGKWKIYCFFIRVLFEATVVAQGMRSSKRFINMFNMDAVKRFLDVTYKDGYEKYMPEPLGSVVEAVFTDEPSSFPYMEPVEKTKSFPSFSVNDRPNNEIPVFPYYPWDEAIPTRFNERYGYSLIEHLPDLFEDTPLTRKVRCDFLQLLGDMGKEAFPEQIRKYLNNRGVWLSGHYFGETTFDFQPVYFGDILDHLKNMDIPGCDNLRSAPDKLRYCMACKIASSAAHIVGKDKVLIEASNMLDADQNMNLLKLKAAISMMFIHGVNTISSYYGENLLSESEMAAFAKHTGMLSSLFDGGKYKIDTLLYYPFKQLCAACEPQGPDNLHEHYRDGLCVTQTGENLIKRQVCFDVANREVILNCQLSDGCIVTPYGEKVSNIVLPNITWLDEELSEFLLKAKEHKVRIIAADEVVEIENLAFKPLSLSESDLKGGAISLEGSNPFVTVMHRDFDDYELFMVMNTDEKDCSVTAKIECDGNKFSLVDLETGDLTAIDFEEKDKKAIIGLDLPALSPAIICKYK